MKTLITIILSFAFCLAESQSIVGTWQTTHETNCLEQLVADTAKTNDTMMKDFSSKSNYSPRVISFLADNSGEERVKTVGKKKSSSVKKFLYKRDGDSLYILDKKSHLIVNTLIIERLTTDSLIYFVAGKDCEKKYYVRSK